MSQCIGYWENGFGLYGVADNISLYVILRDAFENNITASLNANAFVDFTVRTKVVNGETYSTNVNLSAQADSGYEVISFNNRRAGDYLLYVTVNSSSIEGSPFPYTIEPG